MNASRFAICALMAIMTATMMPSGVFAGTTGALRGAITDERNVPVPGAKVTVTSPAQREQTTTDASGRFAFISLIPGLYEVSIAATAFGTQEAGAVAVTADGTTSIVAMVTRRFWFIDGRQSRPRASLIQPWQAADSYIIPSDWPLYDVNGTSIYALHFVPGLTFGAGPILSR